jgi:hypothetical protein
MVLLGAIVAARPTAASSARADVVIRGPGFWSLSRLGHSEQHLPATSPTNVVRLGFRLPRGVAAAARRCYQGRLTARKTCFLILYHFRLRIDPTSQPGWINVSAATNRFTSSQVLFDVRRPADRLQIDWSTLDLIRGHDPHTTTEPEIEVRNINYLQTRGLRDGLNTIDFQLQMSEGVRVLGVDVFADSGLEWSRVPPGRLRLTVQPRKALVGMGGRIRLSYAVTRLGGRAPENVLVEAAGRVDSLEVVGRASRRIPVVRDTVRGTFVLRALRRGRTSVAVRMSSGTDRPTLVVPVVVG